MLEYFFEKKALTLATTHYNEIKNYSITHKGFENASCEFDLTTLKPTYHLLLGIPGSSYAFAISQKLGIPESIIKRASALLSKPDVDIETLMKEIYDDKAEIEKDKIEMQKNLTQVELLRKTLETQNNEKLIKEKEKIENAKREAKEILDDAKLVASTKIKELEQTQDVKKANIIRNDLNDSINKIDVEGLDLSELLTLNNKYNNKSKSVIDKKTSQKKSGKVHINNTKSSSISTEINLIGETVDIAIEILDKYLDSCKMAHLKQVRVIHGKGTGKLRQGIHNYLKKSKYVSSFNIAGFGEGDYGVTIVNLK